MKTHSIPSRGLIVAMRSSQRCRPTWLAMNEAIYGLLGEFSKRSSGDSRPPPGVVDAAQDLARPVPQGKAMTTDLRSAAQVVGLLRGQVTELLGRALEVVESAYACPEWLRHGRTERTNETRAMLLDAVLSQVAEGGPDEMIVGALPVERSLKSDRGWRSNCQTT